MLKFKDAEQIAVKVLEVARANKLNPMCVVVLDARGATLSSKMEDGNPLFREHIARGKAMGALGLGVDSANMVKMYNDRPFFMNALFSMQQNLVPVPGGVLIRDAQSNALLGAVGVSGDASEKDEDCCVHAIKSLGANFSCQAIKENRAPVLKSSL